MPSKCLVALVFCTKLYIKVAVSLFSFSQFSFPFNFRTAKALVLKFCTLPLNCLFSNTLLAILKSFFVQELCTVLYPKNGPNLTCRCVFKPNLISKANFKNPGHGFLDSSCQGNKKEVSGHGKGGLNSLKSFGTRLNSLKSLELGAYFACFHLLDTLSLPGFLCSKTRGGGHIVLLCKNPVPIFRIYSSKVFLKACPIFSLLTHFWFPWKP